MTAWLAELTRRHQLPQKLLVLHQFRLDMLPDRANIHVVPEVALVVQMDGLGDQETKLETWQAITTGGPAGIHFGWKNFYDEDDRCAHRRTSSPSYPRRCTSPTSSDNPIWATCRIAASRPRCGSRLPIRASETGQRTRTATKPSRQRRPLQRQRPGVGVQLGEHPERHGDRVVAVPEPEVAEDRHAEVARGRRPPPARPARSRPTTRARPRRRRRTTPTGAGG